MSAINGDKARFNRDRKSKIARRARNRKQFSNPKAQEKTLPKTVAAAQPAKVSL